MFLDLKEKAEYEKEVVSKLNEMGIDAVIKDNVIIVNGAYEFILHDSTLTKDNVTEKDGVIYISKNLGTESICTIIRLSIGNLNKEKITERLITKIIKDMGMQPVLKGYDYLKTAIICVLKNPDLKMMEVYKAVAKIHNVNPYSIEKTIRYAIDLAYDKNPEQLKKFFNYKEENPYISELLALVADMVKTEIF